LHLVNREFGSLADDFMTLGLLPPGSDKNTIVPALTGVFQVRRAPRSCQVSATPLLAQLPSRSCCVRVAQAEPSEARPSLLPMWRTGLHRGTSPGSDF
jgi:hypothetical protein